MNGEEWTALGIMAGLWVLGLYGLYGLARLGFWLRGVAGPARQGERRWKE